MFGEFQEIYERAKPFLNTRDNEIHTQIAFSFALRLLDKEGGDAKVVLPAVILHDVGWKSLPEELHLKAFGPGHNDMTLNRVHEEEGAKIARRILNDVKYDAALIDEIVAIILEHDSRPQAISLNEAIVKDSDKLWRFSKQALEVDPKRFNIPPAVHTKWLKLQIEGWFITEAARMISIDEQLQRAISFGIQADEHA